MKERQTEKYYLEEVVRKVTGQATVPIGDAVISTLDTAIGCETCEELYVISVILTPYSGIIPRVLAQVLTRRGFGNEFVQSIVSASPYIFRFSLEQGC